MLPDFDTRLAEPTPQASFWDNRLPEVAAVLHLHLHGQSRLRAQIDEDGLVLVSKLDKAALPLNLGTVYQYTPGSTDLQLLQNSVRIRDDMISIPD